MTEKTRKPKVSEKEQREWEKTYGYGMSLRDKFIYEDEKRQRRGDFINNIILFIGSCLAAFVFMGGPWW